MTKSARLFAIALAFVALAQTAALAWMIGERVRMLKSGREMVLDIIPVDPRSLFRGDYVRLSFPISRLKSPGVIVPEGRLKRETPVYVTLKHSDGVWRPTRLDLTPPAIAADRDVVFLAGRIGSDWTNKRKGERTIGVRYGIERYFVPEGEGKRLEKLVRNKKMQVLLSVTNDGRAAIKGLIIEGKLQIEEPLF